MELQKSGGDLKEAPARETVHNLLLAGVNGVTVIDAAGSVQTRQQGCNMPQRRGLSLSEMTG
jgi:hypothetical protein